MCNACGLYWKHHGVYRPLVSGPDQRLTLDSEQIKAVAKTKTRPPKRTASLPVQQISYHPIPLQPKLVPADVKQNGTQADNVKFFMYDGRMITQGDYVVVKGADGHVYFAILTDVWLDEQCRERMCALRWLIPLPEYAEQISGNKEQLSPTYFRIGPDHHQAEPVICIMDVFYSPYKDHLGSSVSTATISSNSGKRPKALATKHVTNIVDDVEAAHLLCTMISCGDQ